ncbi:MAG: aminomethyl-transferring glycine dehydrogenase subunit GcvPA [Eubacteriales bacterium]|nr:aminomethyl-transferring glycine dehydrogenase subunit GcvPA [Eubacteriales bacterium]
MNNQYLPNTPEQRRQMLEAIGAETVEELFRYIPEKLHLNRPLNLPHPLAEASLVAHMEELAGKNNVGAVNFLGGGIYDHFSPIAIDHVLTRSEFYTAYTPYQPEVSQGTLQAIFEYQSMICQLTGADAANASLYDGATAVAEAAILAINATRNRKLLVAGSMHPWYRRVLATYMENLDAEIVEVPLVGGRLDIEAIKFLLGKDVAALMVQSPNFFGIIEDLPALGKLMAPEKGLFVVSADPISLGLLEAPAHLGADVVIGEGQGLGLSQSFGGPLLGFMGVSEKLTRKMPGRVVGQTTDTNGRRGYVLTLQTREQHIRREKATSNICSNQALCALAASVYMSLLGPEGLREVARQSLLKAAFAREQLAAIPGVGLPFAGPFFKEFVVTLPKPANVVIEAMLGKGYYAGIDLGRFFPELRDHLLVAVTEKRSKDEILGCSAALREVLAK